MVIAIISILASMLLPALTKAREKARQAVCTSNLKQLSTIYLLYAQDYDGWIPGMVMGTKYWGDVLWTAGYFKGCSIYNETAAPAFCPRIVSCPTEYPERGAAKVNDGTRYHYGANVYVVDWDNGRKLDKINAPVNRFLLSDATQYWVWVSNALDIVYYVDHRHSGGVNLLYADGHAEFRREELPADSSKEPW